MGSPGDTALLRQDQERGPRCAGHRLQRLLSSSTTASSAREADAYIEKGDDEQALVAMIRAVAAARQRLELAHVRALRLEGHVHELRPAGGGGLEPAITAPVVS